MLNVPTSLLLGGRFRDRVRVYDHGGPSDWLDRGAVAEWAAQKMASPSGFTAHKLGLPAAQPDDPGRDTATG